MAILKAFLASRLVVIAHRLFPKHVSIFTDCVYFDTLGPASWSVSPRCSRMACLRTYKSSSKMISGNCALFAHGSKAHFLQRTLMLSIRDGISWDDRPRKVLRKLLFRASRFGLKIVIIYKRNSSWACVFQSGFHHTRRVPGPNVPALGSFAFDFRPCTVLWSATPLNFTTPELTPDWRKKSGDSRFTPAVQC